METEGSAIAVGIDAAVVANHHVVVRRAAAGGPGEVIEQFSVSPRLEGLDRLTKRLASYPGVVAVAEPTSMTWLPLAIALERAGGALALVGNRHAARLRGALSGKNKSDVIDGEMLSRAGEFFDLAPAPIPDAAELALRRAAQRRHKAVVEANRSLRRLLSLARWAYPDLWSSFGGSRATALGVLGRWPHLGALGRARESSIADVVAAHTEGSATLAAGPSPSGAPRGIGPASGRATSTSTLWPGRPPSCSPTSPLATPASSEPRPRPPGVGRRSGATTCCCARSPGWGRRWRPPCGPSSARHPLRNRQAGPGLRRAQPLKLVERVTWSMARRRGKPEGALTRYALAGPGS